MCRALVNRFDVYHQSTRYPDQHSRYHSSKLFTIELLLIYDFQAHVSSYSIHNFMHKMGHYMCGLLIRSIDLKIPVTSI